MNKILFIGPVETPNSRWNSVGDTRMLELYLRNFPGKGIDLVANIDSPKDLPNTVGKIYNTNDYNLPTRSKYKFLCQHLESIIPEYNIIVIHTSKVVFLINLHDYIKTKFKSQKFYYFMHNPPENLTFTYYHTDSIIDLLENMDNFKLICVSNSHMKRVIDSLGLTHYPKNLCCIPNGITPYERSYESLKSLERIYSATTVGRLDEHKSALESIKVVKTIARKSGKPGLVIGSLNTVFGNSYKVNNYTKWYLEEIQKELSEGISEGILEWEHYLPNEGVLQKMSISDVVVTMSSIETFGLTVAESNIMGTPVLGVDSCGIGELIHNGVNGYKIPIFRKRSNIKVRDLSNMYEEALKLSRAYIFKYGNDVFNIRMSVLALLKLIEGDS